MCVGLRACDQYFQDHDFAVHLHTLTLGVLFWGGQSYIQLFLYIVCSKIPSGVVMLSTRGISW